MKKIIAVIICAMMLFSMTACSFSTNQPSTGDSNKPVQADTNNAFNLNELMGLHKDDVSESVMQKAARLSADINSSIPPSEDYWQECMQFLINEVDRDNWSQVLNCMEWGSDVVNVFNIFDVSDYGHKYFQYVNGQLEFLHYGLWHTPIFSHNIEWTEKATSRVAVLAEGKDSGYILMQNPFNGVYIIELTTTLPTTLTTMSQPGNDNYNVNGPWAKEMVNEAEYNKNQLFATAKEILAKTSWETDMTNQEYWDDFMTFVVENIPSSMWHELLTECNLSYAGDEYYGYPDINRINVLDHNAYFGDEEQWSFNNGAFTIPASSYHYVEWSYNVNWDVDPSDYRSTRNATIADSTKNGVILLMFCDYYFHVVELTNDDATQLTSLAENFDSEFDILFWYPN